MLSIGGKEILLKVVAQAIPVYAMSVFLILKGICKRMMDAISKFWWGDDENSNKMHYGGNCVILRMKGAWVLEISTHSIWQCLPNSLGG
jgi:hypothetical protein